MKLLKTTAFLLAAVIGHPAAAVDSTLLSLIGPDTAAVSGIDVDKVKESPLGKMILSQVKMSEAEAAKLDQAIGFDPRRDLREILIALPNSGSRKGMLMMLRGSFDPSRLTGIAGAMGMPMTSHQGVTMVSNSKSGDWAAIFPYGIAVGDEEAVKGAIERSAKNAKPDAGLASRIQSASLEHDVWMLTTISPSQFAEHLKGRQAPGPAQGSQMDALLRGSLVQGIETMAMGIKFGANIVLSGEAVTRSEKDAAALGDVMKFLASMATSNAQQGAAVFNSLQTNANGRTLKFSVSAPQTDFEQLFKTRGQARVRPVSNR
ncbi:MAG: hypothetical protein FJW39_22640 [Acidobacteria bacterium]|nr:hypothetical protein [Acidobacteriota bacterium]